MKTLVNKLLWTKGQTFLFFAPEIGWPEVVADAIAQFVVSPFEIITTGTKNTLSIEEARYIQAESTKPPTQSNTRLCIIYHIDKAGAEAANALLKVLEEPSPQTIFVLFATTTNVLPTIASRCIKQSVYASVASSEELLLPLEKDSDFATVSIRIAEIVAANQAIDVIDQWLRELLITGERVDAVGWLLEIRDRITQQNVNVQALLEVTYLHITHHITLPHKIDHYLYTHHGHI